MDKCKLLPNLAVIMACFVMLLSACSNEVPAPVNTGEDDNTPTQSACLFDSDCETGQICSSGVCLNDTIITVTDAGTMLSYTPGEDASVLLAQLEMSETGTIEFGAQRLGVSVERTLELENVGNLPLTLVHIVINNDPQNEFDVSPGGNMNRVLEPGEVLQLTIEHTPKDATSDFSMLQVVHTGENGISQIELQAEFKGIPTLWISDDPHHGVDTEIITEMAIGEVPIGSVLSQKLYVRNVGALDSVIALSDFTVTPATVGFEVLPADLQDPEYLSSFIENCTDDDDCPSAFPVCDEEVCFNDEGMAASTYTVEVFFTPVIEGNANGVLSVIGFGNNDEDIIHDITLTGKGLRGRLTATPALLVFEDAYLGYEQASTVIFENTGEAALTLDTLALAEGASWAIPEIELPHEFEPGDQLEVAVTFLGEGALGTLEDQLIGHTTDEDEVQVQIRADMTLPPGLKLYLVEDNILNEIDLEFPLVMPTVSLGEAIHSDIVAFNTGEGTLRLDNIFMGEGSSSRFTVGGMPPLPLALHQSDEQDNEPFQEDQEEEASDAGVTVSEFAVIPIFYDGTSLNIGDDGDLQNDNGTLIISSNDPVQPNLSLHLRSRTVNPLATLSEVSEFPPTLIYTTDPTTQNLTITNTGYGPLQISQLVLPPNSPFSYELPDDFDVPMAHGESRTIVLTFSPITEGSVQQTLKIHPLEDMGGSQEWNIELVGRGSYGTVAASLASSNDYVEALTFSQTDEDIIYVGSSKTLSWSILNNGEVALPVSSLARDGIYAPSFTVENASSWEGSVLEPGETKTLTLSFEPATGMVATTEQSADLVLELDVLSSFPDDEHPHFELQGLTQLAPAAVLTQDDLTELPNNEGVAAIDLGDVPSGLTKFYAFRVRNEGLGNLDILNSCFVDDITGACLPNIESLSGFTIAPVGPVSDIGSVASQRYAMTFTPTMVYLAGGQLLSVTKTFRVLTSDPDASQFEVSFTARPSNPEFLQSLDTYNFGPVYRQSTVSSSDGFESLYIQNTGYGDLVIRDLQMGMGSSLDFTLNAGTLPVTLAHNETYNFEVTYTPDELNADSGTVFIDYDYAVEGTEAQSVITLSGVGTDCEDGRRDLNEDPQDGCECEPIPSQGDTCFHENANTICSAGGGCVFDGCLAGWQNLDGELANGCEYECTVVSDTDIPDSAGIDENCDGVDGDIVRGVFVSVDGNDTGNGSPLNPVRTFERAQQLVDGDSNKDSIYMTSGIYPVNETITLEDGQNVYGSFTYDFAGQSFQKTVISSSEQTTAMEIANLSAPLTVASVAIETDNATTFGSYRAALIVSNAGDYLTLRDVHVIAGFGGPGASGVSGFAGMVGSPGSPASNDTGGDGGSFGGGDAGDGGSGGMNAYYYDDYEYSGFSGTKGADSPLGTCRGGRGGFFGKHVFDAYGLPVSGLGGYQYGIDYSNCAYRGSLVPGDGLVGGNAYLTSGGANTPCVAATGANGSDGDGLGMLTGLNWAADVGGLGEAGEMGAGGGGGGGGAGDLCLYGGSYTGDPGRAGGGGGGGGTGGQGGKGGQGGGASIGIIIKDSTLNFEDVIIETLGGGIGGQSGFGGIGGMGGRGGPGSIKQVGAGYSMGSGGDGGDGGQGGDGGCGGSGGGGPSVGVWGAGNGVVTGSVDYDLGPGGAHGYRCGVSAGNTGDELNTKNVSQL